MGHKTEMTDVIVTYRGKQPSFQNGSNSGAISDLQDKPADYHTEILPPEGEPIVRVIGEIRFPVWATRQAVQSAIVPSSVDVDPLTEEDLQILDELNVREVTEIPADPTPEEIERVLEESAAQARAARINSEAAWHAHILTEGGFDYTNGNRSVPKRSGPGRPKSQATIDREALEAANQLYEETYGRY